MKLSATDLEDMVIERKRLSRGLIVLVLFLVLAAPAGYYLGLERSGNTVKKNLQADALQLDNLLLKRELADLRLARKVDEGTGEQLRQTIKQLRDKTSEINEELNFYRDLMAPSENQKGLRIEKLSLEESADATRVEYRLMLTQIADRRDWVQGRVNIDVIGVANGLEQVLSLTDFAIEQEYPFKFKFRYFQDFTGILTMPKAFRPDHVLVTAVSIGKKGKRLQRKFSWDDLTR